MADLVVYLTSQERDALEAVGGSIGLTADDMASAILRAALDRVVASVVSDSPYQPLEVPHGRSVAQHRLH